MLLTFTVSNYRSIKERQTLSLVGTSLSGPHDPFEVAYPGGSNGILPCAIIYGANASGKSNILSALVSMHNLVLNSHALSSREKKLPHSPFLLDSRFTNKPTSYEVCFIKNGIRYDYGFSHDSDRVIDEWLYSYPEGRRRKVYERMGKDVSFGQGMKGAKKVLSSFLGETSLFLSVAMQNAHEDLATIAEFFYDFSPMNRISVASGLINHSFSDGKVDNRAILFLEAVGSGVCGYRVDENEMPEDEQKVMTEIMKVITSHLSTEGDLTPPEINQKKYEVKLAHKSKSGDEVYFTGSQESAGTRRLLLMMNAVFKALDEGDLTIIDEIDASLHTFAVEAIIALFTDARTNRYGAQLVATTHDTNLLDQDRLRRDEIWFVEKSIDGSSEYFSLAEIRIRRGEAIEKAYLQGRYGAAPPRLPPEVFLAKSNREMG